MDSAKYVVGFSVTKLSRNLGMHVKKWVEYLGYM